MKLLRNRCIGPIEPLHAAGEAKTLIPSCDNKHSEDHEFDGYEVKSKSRFNVIREFGFGCFSPDRRRRISSERNLKPKNQQWFQEESNGTVADEPHSSVYSSFKLDLCSQIELEPNAANQSCSPATILMVNLESGFSTNSDSAEVLSRRIEFLERTISPVTHTLIRFSYCEILSATKFLRKGRVLGRGAISSVYKGRVGFLRTAVAIKKLNKKDEESSKAFCRELMIAGSLHNPHVVPLVGFCIDAEEGLFLVYKYVSGGSLEQRLYEKSNMSGGPALSWSARYKVAVGVAEAIAYLHNGADGCVVHRDVKPSNILLSFRKTAMLCDFGLAVRTQAPSVPFLCKMVKGTFGYLAPEYFQHGKVSDKTDVYAFGVVLLELLTGRRPTELQRGPREENLVLWAKPWLQQGRYNKLLDPEVKVTGKNSLLITRMVRAATSCLENEESSRPNIGMIIPILRGEDTYSLDRKKAALSGNSSTIYG